MIEPAQNRRRETSTSTGSIETLGAPRTTKERIVAVTRALLRLKGGYQNADRFTQMRIWIVSLVALDLVAATLFAVVLSWFSVTFFVWYENAFPSNLLVIQNEGGPVSDVELVLDQKYRARVAALPSGPLGLALGREFRDEDGVAPPGSYRPNVLVLTVDGSSHQLTVATAASRD